MTDLLTPDDIRAIRSMVETSEDIESDCRLLADTALAQHAEIERLRDRGAQLVAENDDLRRRLEAIEVQRIKAVPPNYSGIPGWSND